MPAQTPWKKILWAVDPFDETESAVRSAAWALKGLTRKSPAIIQPVHLLSGHAIEVPPGLPNDLVSQLKKSAEDAMQGVLTRVKLSQVEPIEILSQPFVPLRQGIQELIGYARSKNFDLIVLSTHGRQGPRRWLMGSFAENLVLHASIPLFIVNPTWNNAADFDHILFPTDFSPESRFAFERIIKMAKMLESEVTLFHKIIYPLTPAAEVAIAANPEYQDVFKNHVDNQRTTAEIWTQHARDAGVKIEMHLDYTLGGSPVDAILKVSEDRPGIIALASHSGPISSILLGSVTRSLCRLSPYPLWIIHPDLRHRENLDRGPSVAA